MVNCLLDKKKSQTFYQVRGGAEPEASRPAGGYMHSFKAGYFVFWFVKGTKTTSFTGTYDLQGLSLNAIFIPFEQVFWLFDLSNEQKLHLETGCKICRAQNVTFITFEQFSHVSSHCFSWNNACQMYKNYIFHWDTS